MGKSREIRSLGQMRRKDCFLYSDCRIFRQSVLNQRSEQVASKPCSPAVVCFNREVPICGLWDSFPIDICGSYILSRADWRGTHKS